LSDINIPILDIYGTRDIEGVLTSVEQRQKASKHNTGYVQQQITGDHFFNEKEELLVNAVNAWLNQLMIK
jgi:alpha/beta superfamily hydrolase